MKYGSVCSGIEAATAAWAPLGWTPAFFSEIEPFARAVLEHHYPDVPLHGDFTTIEEGDYEPIDVLVGGTPCQDFSVAGLRRGFAGDRGNLTLQFICLAERLRPTWIVWENVPGVLSIDGGRAFGAVLGGLADIGFGFAYRIFDAQYLGLAQRRERVFVVGHPDWRRAAAVLFERESLRGNPAPRREKGQEVALPVTTRVDRGGEHREAHGNNLIVSSEISPSLRAQAQASHRADSEVYVAHALTAEGFIDTVQGTQCVAFHENQRGELTVNDTVGSLKVGGGKPGQGYPAVAFNITPSNSNRDYSAPLAVRRLTPVECERLQGFPDGYTLITYRGKPAADGPRYKALGNAMAVPVMRWIGERIRMVKEL
jgi:DNA (cytosine-5)-methyltransferase 1